jgi:hypothetical protein
VQAFVAALPHEARALLIRGEAGIGKTAVWRHAVDECVHAGFEVLVTRPAKDEMPLGLAGLVDLFDRVELDTAALLAEENPFARGRLLLAALRRLARDGPVVVAIDDLQWLDLASVRALRYALRRLDAEPVGVLATVRAGQDREDQLAPASILPRGRCEELDVGPLDLEALRRVLGPVVDPISRPALRRIHEVSGGNPLYAIELARGLAADTAGAGGGLHLPESLRAAIARRLESVGDELSGVLDVVSALGPTSVKGLCQVLGDVDLDALLARAERLALLVVEEDLRVRFSHPLVGSVAYARMRPLARRALHARLAAGATDPDVRARHLALSTDEPSAPISRVLEDAAERARARGAIDLAAEFAGHSLRLTPPGDAGAALRRALREIEDLAVAGEMSRALRLADRLVATLPAGPGRAEVLVKRAYVEDDHVDRTEALLRGALDDAGADERLRGYVIDQLGWLRGMFKGDLAGGLARAREAAALAVRLGDKPLEMTCTGALAYLEGLGGTLRPELMTRAVGLEAEIGNPVMWTSPRALHAEHLLWAGDLPASRALFDEVRDSCVRSGAEINQPYCLFDLALVECAAGNLLAADNLAREGIRAARDAEDAWGARLLLYPLSLVEAWTGRAAAARASAGRRLEEATAGGERPGIVRARGVLGLLALSEDDSEAAALELAEAARCSMRWASSTRERSRCFRTPSRRSPAPAIWMPPACCSSGSNARRRPSTASGRWPRSSGRAASNCSRAARPTRRSRRSAAPPPRSSGWDTARTARAPSSCVGARCCAVGSASRPPTRWPTRAGASRTWAPCSGRRAPRTTSSAPRRVGRPERSHPPSVASPTWSLRGDATARSPKRSS